MPNCVHVRAQRETFILKSCWKQIEDYCSLKESEKEVFRKLYDVGNYNIIPSMSKTPTNGA